MDLDFLGDAQGVLMKKSTLVALSLLMIPTAIACNIPWQKCWHGQTLQGQQCTGEVVLLSAFDAKQMLQDDPNLRLPTRVELEMFFMGSHVAPLREHAHRIQKFQVLTSDFMQHGNEFLATTVDIRNGRVELTPWREPTLVILRKTNTSP